MENIVIRPLVEADLVTVERWARTACWWDSSNTLRATWAACKGHWLGAYLEDTLVGESLFIAVL